MTQAADMNGAREYRRQRWPLRYRVCISIVFSIIAVAAVVAFLLANPICEPMTLTCETEICRHTAQRLLSNINTMIDPCIDFYHFACDGYLRTTMIPEGKNKISIVTELEDQIEDELRQLLENFSGREDTLIRPEREAVQLYSLCIDEATINKYGVVEARKLFQEAGGWPLLENNSLEVGWTFQETEKNLKKLNMEGNSLLKVTAETDETGIHFVVQKPDLISSPYALQQFTKEPLVYHQYMVDTMVLYGAERELANLTMKQVLDFETAFGALIKSRNQVQFSSNYTVNQLNSLPSMSWISWSDLLKAAAPQIVDIAGDQRVLVHDPEYVDELNNFLNKRKDSVVNYMFWVEAERLAPLVSDKLHDLHLQYRGIRQPEPRWRQCLQFVKSQMGIALSSLYVKNYIDKAAKTLAETMGENIRHQIIENIHNSYYASGNKQEKIVDDVKRIQTHLAYPKQLLDKVQLEIYHKDLNINKDVFLRAYLEVCKWYRDTKIMQVQRGGSSDWARFGPVLSPEAQFSATEKTVAINASLLQPPLFSPSLPAYINYGSIGYLLAHLFTHAHLDQVLPTEMDNTKTTEGQIKYKGALEMAYLAYLKNLDQARVPEPDLPGLQQYSHYQLFMLSMANMMCTNYRPETLKQGGKSPVEIRVNNGVKKSQIFKEIFNCNQF